MRKNQLLNPSGRAAESTVLLSFKGLAVLFLFLVTGELYAQSILPGTTMQGDVAAKQKGPLVISMKQAVDIAIAPDGNAKVRMADEVTRQTRARMLQARAFLLPNLDGSISQQNQTRNLAAFGIKINLPVPGFSMPEKSGPFNLFDARASLTQSVFDMSSIRRYQSSRAGYTASISERENVHEKVAGMTARAYLMALVADAKVETHRANVSLAETIVELATNQKAAGTGTGIEVTRAQVQLANERQRLLVAEKNRKEAYLQLLRVMGMNLGTELRLAEKLSYIPVEPLVPEDAVGKATKSRFDLHAQEQREEGARLNHSATKLERAPSVVAFGDYGSIGSGINNSFATRVYGIAVKVPIFDGGRRDAKRYESASSLQQESIRTSDLRQQIEYEVRVAIESVRSAEQMVTVAQEGVTFAEAEFAQAQRRYQAGVTTSVEVTDAQTRVERARDNLVNALLAANLARLDLAEAMGQTRNWIK